MESPLKLFQYAADALDLSCWHTSELRHTSVHPGGMTSAHN
jgi:hypothetical protein